VRAGLGKSVAGVVEAGQALEEASVSLPRSEYLKLLRDDVRLGQRAAEMLRAVGKHPVLSDPANHGSLPSSWRTLYELTKMPSEELLRQLKDGTINPETERSEVIPPQDEDARGRPQKRKRERETIRVSIDFSIEVHAGACVAAVAEFGPDLKSSFNRYVHNAVEERLERQQEGTVSEVVDADFDEAALPERRA